MAADDTEAGAEAGKTDDDSGRDGGDDTSKTTTAGQGRDGQGDDDLPEGAKKALSAARRAEREAARRAAAAEAKVQEFEDRDKSEAQKAADQAKTARDEADKAKSEALRMRVAMEKKLPVELIDRLKGTTREELEADADELVKLVKPEATSFDGGVRKSAPAGGMDALIREAAGYAP